MKYIQIFQQVPTQRKEFIKENDNRNKFNWMISNKRFLFNDFAGVYNNIILTKYIFSIYTIIKTIFISNNVCINKKCTRVYKSISTNVEMYNLRSYWIS